MSAELMIKPCPFCGGEGKVRWDHDQRIFGVKMAVAVVECSRCAARGTPAGDVGLQEAKELAVRNWNTRSERGTHG